MPSPPILAHWAPPTATKTMVYADVGSMHFKEAGLVVMPWVVQFLVAYWPSIMPCMGEWMGLVREFALAFGATEDLMIFRYRREARVDSIPECVDKWLKLPPVDISSKGRACGLSSGRVLLILPDAMLIGSRARVEASLSASEASEWPQALALGDNEQLAFVGVEPRQHIEIRAGLTLVKGRFAVQADLGFPDVAAAKAAAEALAPERVARLLVADLAESFAGVGTEMPAFDELIDRSWRIEREWKEVAVLFDAEGDSAQVEEGAFVATTLMFHWLREYIQDKSPEARSTIGAIASRVQASGRKRLSSLPPVPSDFRLVQGKSAPRGVSASSTRIEEHACRVGILVRDH